MGFTPSISVTFPIIFSSRVYFIAPAPQLMNRFTEPSVLERKKRQKSFTCDFMLCKINSWKRNAEYCKIIFEILSHRFPAETFYEFNSYQSLLVSNLSKKKTSMICFIKKKCIIKYYACVYSKDKACAFIVVV